MLAAPSKVGRITVCLTWIATPLPVLLDIIYHAWPDAAARSSFRTVRSLGTRRLVELEVVALGVLEVAIPNRKTFGAALRRPGDGGRRRGVGVYSGLRLRAPRASAGQEPKMSGFPLGQTRNTQLLCLLYERVSPAILKARKVTSEEAGCFEA